MATLRSLVGLNDSTFARYLREKKPKTSSQSKKVRNVLTCIDHLLVAWEKDECCLLVKNLLDVGSNRNEAKPVKDRFLKFSLTDSPVFQVENLQANLDGSLVVLSGSQGVACVELPHGLTSFDGHKEGPLEKIARSVYIDEQFLTCNAKVQVKDVKFHPGSPSNSHLVVLTSDNCIRIYDVFHPSRPEKTIPVGPKTSHFSMRSGLGNTLSANFDEAVSFDFGVPYEAPTSSRDPSKRDSVPIFIFPIYVLLANGDVYTFSCTVQSNSSRAPKITAVGPLMMQPASLDNYGGDACSILCLPVSPPVLVIANSTGNVHHAILLPRGNMDDSDSEGKPDIPDDLESLISRVSLAGGDTKADSVLHVIETLELDGDILDDSGALSADESFESESFLSLHKDPACSSRYFVAHDYGIHAVVVPLVDTLADLAAKKDQDVNPDDTRRAMLAETVVEFILCSRMKTSAPSPPQGIALYSLPPTLFVLLDTAEIQIISLSRLLKPAPKPTAPASTQKVAKESFEDLIRRQLLRTHSQPKLSLPPGTDLPITEIVKLFSRSVQTLRDEYIVKQEAVRETLEKKTKLLALHLQQQLDELELIKQSKEELTGVAHTLADKYEDAVETQKLLTQRTEKVLFEIQKRSPVLTDVEKQMSQQLRQLDNRLHTMRQSIESLKRREQLYGNKVEQVKSSSEGGSLTEEQRTSVNEALALQSEDIAALLKSLQQIKKKLAA